LPINGTFDTFANETLPELLVSEFADSLQRNSKILMYELEKNTPLSMYISRYLLMQLLKKDLSHSAAV
jgi:hypothetical protein